MKNNKQIILLILNLDDCTVRLYDLRTKNNCLKDHCHDDILIKSHWGITSMDVNPMNSNEIVCACADSVSYLKKNSRRSFIKFK